MGTAIKSLPLDNKAAAQSEPDFCSDQSCYDYKEVVSFPLATLVPGYRLKERSTGLSSKTVKDQTYLGLR